jgi:queuine tRNA-ribosyltransferase
MTFELIVTDGKSAARRGRISTPHGDIDTPVFMPVGTAGTVKGIHQHELKEDVKASIILGNTYHLFLRPGTGVIRTAGGIHGFMGWDRPVLTDSGGYQVFSLAEQRKISEQGAVFQSHVDGVTHRFTPENVVDIQREIGADIMMAFDECTPFPCEFQAARESMELTHRWLARGYERFINTEPLYGYDQALFPIIQGSTYENLRKMSAEYVCSLDLPGNAIGGLSVGEPAEEMYQMIEIVNMILTDSKPRYLMGVGTPVNILEAVALGIDMFDCVIPTRNGRNGMLFTSEGIINIKNEKWRNDHSPLDADGNSYVDGQYSRAYLRHLIMSKELLGAQIASLHNLSFYTWLMAECQRQISAGSFARWKSNMTEKLSHRL